MTQILVRVAARLGISPPRIETTEAAWRLSAGAVARSLGTLEQ